MAHRNRPYDFHRSRLEPFKRPIQLDGTRVFSGDCPLNTLHDTCLQPSHFLWADAPVRITPAVICFPAFNGFSNFLVLKDLPEVCPLSRGARVELLSGSLQTGLRFLRHPLPATPSAHLTARFPSFVKLRM